MEGAPGQSRRGGVTTASHPWGSRSQEGHGSRDRGGSQGAGCSWPWTCSHFQEESVLLGKEQSRGAEQCCRRDPGLTWRYSLTSLEAEEYGTLEPTALSRFSPCPVWRQGVYILGRW